MGLLNWLRPAPRCPVDPPARAWLDRRWAWLESQFGPESARRCDVVLPRPEFFPDPYHATEDDARGVFGRVCGFMGIDPRCVELSLFEGGSPFASSPLFVGRWEGAAGLYQRDGDLFRIWVESASLHEPVGMVATMAHELAHVHLLGHGRVSPDEEDHEPLTDLLTVYLGLGVLSANSVVSEGYWHDGNLSGWSLSRRGYTDMRSYGYALARFARLREEADPAWARELRPDVRQAYKQAARFLATESPPRPPGDLA